MGWFRGTMIFGNTHIVRLAKPSQPRAVLLWQLFVHPRWASSVFPASTISQLVFGKTSHWIFRKNTNASIIEQLEKNALKLCASVSLRLSRLYDENSMDFFLKSGLYCVQQLGALLLLKFCHWEKHEKHSFSNVQRTRAPVLQVCWKACPNWRRFIAV